MGAGEGTGGGRPGGRAWRGLVSSSLVQLNRPAPGTHSARSASPGHVAMCPPTAPGTAQSSWGRRGSPTFHRRHSPARAGCGKCAQGHRAEGPQILGGHWPHGWGGGGETGRGLTRHQPALPRRTEPLSRLPWHSQQRPTLGRAQGALSPPAGGRARGHSLQGSRRA